MLAGIRRHGAPVAGHRARSGDDGYSLLEVVVAIGLIGIVMSTMTVFFTRTAATVSQHTGLRTAIQLATDRMEQIRAIRQAADVTAGSDAPQLDGIRYARDWSIRRCWQRTNPRGGACTYSNTRPAAPATGSWADFLEVTVEVDWPDRGCPGGVCTYRTASLISRSDLEPVFNTKTGTP